MMSEWRLRKCTPFSTLGCDENKRHAGGDEALDGSAAMLNCTAQYRLERCVKKVSRRVTNAKSERRGPTEAHHQVLE